jgi:hypothetical protein
MSNIIKTDFDGTVMQFTADGWFNATTAASRYDKEPHEWLRLPETERYLSALARSTSENIPYVKTSRARADRGGGTWLHPKLAVVFSRWLDDDFAVWCDMQIDSLVRGTAGVSDRLTAHIEAASRFRGVSDMLNLTRTADGKATAPHHYSNEALMINEILTGSRAPLDRKHMSQTDLRLLELLQAEDMRLICQKLTYAERKEALLAFSDHRRSLAGCKSTEGHLMTAALQRQAG